MRLLQECSEEKKWDVRMQERARQKGQQGETVSAKSLPDDASSAVSLNIEELARWDGKGYFKAGQ